MTLAQDLAIEPLEAQVFMSLPRGLTLAVCRGNEDARGGKTKRRARDERHTDDRAGAVRLWSGLRAPESGGTAPGSALPLRLSRLQLETEREHLKGIIWMTDAGASDLTFCSGC